MICWYWAKSSAASERGINTRSIPLSASISGSALLLYAGMAQMDGRHAERLSLAAACSFLRKLQLRGPPPRKLQPTSGSFQTESWPSWPVWTNAPDPAARDRAGIASTARQAGDGRPSLTKSICPCAAGRSVYMPQPPQTRRGRRVQDPMRHQFITARSGMLWRAHAAVLYAPVAEQADAPASKAASLCRFDSCLAHQYADTARRARVHNGHKRR